MIRIDQVPRRESVSLQLMLRTVVGVHQRTVADLMRQYKALLAGSQLVADEDFVVFRKALEHKVP